MSERDVHLAQVYRRLFVPSATSALKRIRGGMDASVRYVISSTWRKSFSGEQLEVVFQRAGLGFAGDHLHAGETWRTPPKFGRSRRFNEIAEWLDRHHQGQPFAVLDDTHSGALLTATVQLSPMLPLNVPAPRHPSEAAPHPFAGRVVLCDENVGLTSDYVAFIVAALRRLVPMPSVPK